MSTEIYSKQSCQIKMVYQNLETIWLVIRFFSLVKNIVYCLWLVIRYFSLVKKVISIFPPFGAASQSGNVHNFRCFPWLDHGFKVCRYCFSRTIYRKLNRMLLCLRNFWRWRTSQDLWKKFPQRSWMHTSANLSLLYERKTTTKTTNPAPYVLWWPEEFNISVKSLNKSPTVTSPETEMKSTTRYKRLNILDSDSE